MTAAAVARALAVCLEGPLVVLLSLPCFLVVVVEMAAAAPFFRGRFEFAAFAICLIITSACSSSVFASSRKLSSLQAQGWGSGGYFASESNIRGDHTTCILPGPRRRAFNHPRDEKLALLAS